MSQPHDRSTELANRRNYPLNCWYVAARSQAVTAALFSSRVTDIPMLLVRAASGRVAALEDRSPHRPYPLSAGRLDGDRIVSAFDGWVFDLTGACVSVPSQARLPLDARVRTFPVHDDGTFVFVWPGNAAVAALRPPPHSAWDDPHWTAAGGQLDVAANYLLLHEIFADATLLPFVAPEVVPPALRATVPPPLDVEVSENSVSFSRNFAAVTLPDWHARAVGLPVDGRYPQREHGRFVSPGMWVHRWEAEHERRAHVLGFTQATTPITAGLTRLYWWVSRDASPEDTALTDLLRAAFEDYYARVAGAAATMQKVLDTDGPRADVNVSADLGALQVRKIVSALVREETGIDGARRRSRRIADL